MSAHTPGPWQCDGVEVQTLQGGAVVDCTSGYDLMAYNEACANARLIAAAPDLLAALKALRGVAAMEANPIWDENRAFYWIYAFGRLKPGVSLEQARASLKTLYSGIINEVDAPLFSALLLTFVEE